MTEPFPPSQPPYGQDSTMSYGAPPPKASGMAIASMVLGILSLPLMCAFGLGLPLGIVALVLGIIGLKSINKDPRQQSGKGFAITGIVLGCVSFLALPLMIALLIPSLGKSRELAKRSMCSANLRGTMQSMCVYAADNNDAYPIRSPIGGYGLAGSPSPNVTENMWILVENGQVAPKQYLCKSDPAVVTPAPAGGTDFPSDMNYSYSFAYPWMATPPPRGLPGGPTNVGSWWRNMTDASLPLISDMAPLTGTGSPAAMPAAGSGKAANSFNHQGDGQNVGYGDAHAEFARSPAVGQAGDNIFTFNAGTPSSGGTAFLGGMKPGIGNGGTAGMYDICVVPVADASKGYARK